MGGATISTPAIRVLGASALTAVGTTLPSIIPSAVSGTLRYSREGLVLWDVVRWVAPFGVAASVGGALLSRVIPGEGHWLMLVTALLLGWTSWRMARTPATVPEAVEGEEPLVVPPPHRAVLPAIGLVSGAMSGLLGVGGGVLMVPAFTQLADIPLKTAIATSLACVGIFAIPGTITHAALGGIDWRFALLLGIGVIPGARIGAAAVMRTSDRRLRIAVASFLGLVAVLYAAGELADLLSS
ncbi:MAG TPA: sulfite exporter TauE/SafE family protein [Acidimicrobiales bacterium]|nr:sulfite exporter TauE/SafE family protein [Acidimicrobiales bacterium]